MEQVFQMHMASNGLSFYDICGGHFPLTAEDRHWWIKRLEKHHEQQNKQANGDSQSMSRPNVPKPSTSMPNVPKPSMPSIPRR